MLLPVVFNTFCKILKIGNFAVFGEYLNFNEITSMVKVEQRMFSLLLLRNATVIATQNRGNVHLWLYFQFLF